MLKIPNSMLPTSCWTVATKLTKKNSWSRQHNISTLLNQIYTNIFGAFELLVGPLSELFLWKNWRGSASCSCCTPLVQPAANLHCFIAIISLVHWSIWPSAFNTNFTNFRFGFFLLVVLFFDLVVCNHDVLIPSNFSQWVSINRILLEYFQCGVALLLLGLPQHTVDL